MLNDEDIVWKYLDFTDLLHIIYYKTLTLINATKFEDKLEGYNPNDPKWKEKASKCYVSSWHKNKYESDAMWKLYTKDTNNAVAIKTTCGVLKEIASTHFIVGEVGYTDYVDFKEDEPLLWKRNRFEFEREVRIIEKTDRATKDVSFLNLRDGKLELLLKEIYISPYAPNRFNEVVKFILIDKLGLKSKLRGSNEFQGGIII